MANTPFSFNSLFFLFWDCHFFNAINMIPDIESIAFLAVYPSSTQQTHLNFMLARNLFLFFSFGFHPLLFVIESSSFFLISYGLLFYPKVIFKDFFLPFFFEISYLHPPTSPMPLNHRFFLYNSSSSFSQSYPPLPLTSLSFFSLFSFCRLSSDPLSLRLFLLLFPSLFSICIYKPLYTSRMWHKVTF